jgi:hypothetical protein
MARSIHRFRAGLAVAVGASLGWALMVHLGHDTLISLAARRARADQTRTLRSFLQDRSALVGYWSTKDAAGGLLFDRDVVIVDAKPDEGEDAPTLIDELLKSGRRVFVLEEGMPPEIRRRLVANRQTILITVKNIRLVELRNMRI